MAIDPDAFRRIIGNFATGVTVVTLPPEDDPHGITVNAFSSVSLEPPLVLICLDHDTEAYERLSTDGVDGYCVNVLTTEQVHLGKHFADIDVLPESPFDTDPTRVEVTGAPIFEDGLAYLDCSVTAAHREGDHTIYIGRVEQADTLRTDARPVTFYQGQWGSVSAEL